MKWLGYSWAVIEGIIKLGIAVSLATAFEAPFERAVICLLILIYVAIEGHAIASALALVEQAKLGQIRFLETMELLESKRYEDEEVKELIEAEREKTDRNVTKGSIRSVFIFLIFLFAVFSLFGAL